MIEKPTKDDSRQEHISQEAEFTENSVKEKKSEQRNESSKHNVWSGIGYITQIGITLAVTVFIGVLIGRVLDDWLGTEPWLLLLFSILGAAAAIKQLFDMSKRKR
ncbi:MAG: AtpZ/AtpI family protein [Eubacteriales bacterium]|nr:AtpZ/AtpI family protein [Eubacteriales bacterium]MDD4324052.1 AtpZ/AtpI family protein [Eubacteriales bacterium]MDD4541922.1 AtpZ/AtpI family protein [Eubacteriales bacterium]